MDFLTDQPDDWVKQSFPFFYVAVSVSTTDGKPHTVSLYSDVTGGNLSSVELRFERRANP